MYKYFHTRSHLLAPMDDLERALEDLVAADAVKSRGEEKHEDEEGRKSERERKRREAEEGRKKERERKKEKGHWRSAKAKNKSRKLDAVETALKGIEKSTAHCCLKPFLLLCCTLFLCVRA